MTSPGIVLVTTSYPIAHDGSEAAGAFVKDLAYALALHVPVRVVAPGRAQCIEHSGTGVTVHRFAAPSKPLSTLRLWHPADLMAIAAVMASGLAATRQAVDAAPTSRIVALWALPSAHWARSVSRTRALPYDVWALGSDIWTLGKIPLMRGWLARVLADADRCFADGVKLAEDTRAIAAREVAFLPSTRRIDQRRVRPLRDGPPYRLLFLGRWHPNKGIDLLLDALKMLGEDDWSRIESVTIHGGGPLEPLVREQGARLVAAGRNVIVGEFLDQSAAEQAIVEADWIVIPSRVESIPVIFSDAMKLKCPVIAMPVGDLPMLVGEGVGFTASRATADALVGSIREALACSPLRFEDAMERMALRFDLDAVARTLLRPSSADGR